MGLCPCTMHPNTMSMPNMAFQCMYAHRSSVRAHGILVCVESNQPSDVFWCSNVLYGTLCISCCTASCGILVRHICRLLGVTWHVASPSRGAWIGTPVYSVVVVGASIPPVNRPIAKYSSPLGPFVCPAGWHAAYHALGTTVPVP